MSAAIDFGHGGGRTGRDAVARVHEVPGRIGGLVGAHPLPGIDLAGRVADQSISRAVSGIAGLHRTAMQERQIVLADGGLVTVGLHDAGIPAVVHAVLDGEHQRRGARHHAVEVLRIALNGHQRLAPAVGATRKIGVLRWLTIIAMDEFAGDEAGGVHGAVAEVHPQLHVGGGPDAAGAAGVTHVGRGHGQRAVSFEGAVALRGMDGQPAAQPAAAGLKVALRPAGHGQPHDEADLGRDDALHQAHRLAIDVLRLHRRDLCGRLGQRDIGKAVERAGQPGHDRRQVLDRLGVRRQRQGPEQGSQQEGQAAAKAPGLQYHRDGIRERQDPAVYRVVATRQQNAPSAWGQPVHCGLPGIHLRRLS